MKTDEIYDAGYAIPMYNILLEFRYWRYRDEEYSIPSGAVWPTVKLPGVMFGVAPIEMVRKAASGRP